MPANIESIIEKLKTLVNRPSELAVGIPEVQQDIWHATEPMESDARLSILRDLAYDLDYFQSDPKVRSEDRSFYGEEKALTEIAQALAKLGVQT